MNMLQTNKCPVCGSEAEVDLLGTIPAGFIVYCSNHNCILSDFGREPKLSAIKAVKDWNKKNIIR